jgi:hypothetical protein
MAFFQEETLEDLTKKTVLWSTNSQKSAYSGLIEFIY